MTILANGARANLGRVPDSVLAVLALGAPVNAVIFAEEDLVIRDYRDRQDQLVAASTSILDLATAEKRELTREEKAEVDQNSADFDRLEGEITSRVRIAAQAAMLSAPRGRQTEANATESQPGDEPVRAPYQNIASHRPQAAASQPTYPQPRQSAAGNHGFRTLGEFANSVRVAASRGGEWDQRLVRNATLSTYSQESVGADGGFAVPPDFRASIMEQVMAPDSLLGRCDNQQSSSNNMTFPVDETTAWQSTGGIQAYWEGEAGTITQSKPALGQVNLRLHKLTSLVPVTEEQLSDVTAMDSYLRRKAPEKINYKVSDAIIRGTGAGMPKGVLESGALVTVSKETSQAADTLKSMNVFKMWARMYAPSRQNAIWLINQDLEPQLYSMTVDVKNMAGSENVGGAPVYIPPGGINGSPFGLLMGRPVVPHEVCSAIGDVGDVILGDFSKYLAVTKPGGVRTDTSIHLWFDQDVTAFRFTFRLAGQPWRSAPITRANGSNTLSDFVTLEAR